MKQYRATRRAQEPTPEQAAAIRAAQEKGTEGREDLLAVLADLEPGGDPDRIGRWLAAGSVVVVVSVDALWAVGEEIEVLDVDWRPIAHAVVEEKIGARSWRLRGVPLGDVAPPG